MEKQQIEFYDNYRQFKLTKQKRLPITDMYYASNSRPIVKVIIGVRVKLIGATR
jgi:hypothetical protein